jgi:lipid-A-disaccharide synthase
MISCGEPSGDLYAGALAAEILRLDPSAYVTGFGGDRLRAAGATLIANFSGLSVTGISEAARVLPRAYAAYRRLIVHAEAARPDVLVAVDFPDFNFVLAKALKKRRIPVIYYISPQLWAWRPGRLKTMRRVADLVLVIFKFEEAIYRNAGVPVQWVGHPLLDVMQTVSPRQYFLARLGLTPDEPVIALLPGSRRNEVRAILPGLVAAAALIRERVPAAQFVLARAPRLPDELFGPVDALAQSGRVARVEGVTDEVLATADIALIASGTATVQAALHECPMVVVYRLSPFTYYLGRPFVHVNTFAMANLVAGRQVVPELIQDEFTPQAVAQRALELLLDDTVRARVRADLRAVKAQLGEPGASRRAAQAVLEVGSQQRAGSPSARL